MRYRKLAVIACSLLLACTVGFQSAGFVADAASKSELQQSIDKYTNDLKALEKQQEQIAKDKEALKQDQTKKEQLKEQLQRQISNTQQQISLCNKEIDDLNAEISAQEKQIEEKNAELEQNKETFKQRVRAMYMSGGNSDLLMLLGADDFADYLNRSELSRSVSQHDQDLMEQIANAISEIEAEKVQIEAKKEERTSAKKTLAAKQKDLKDQMAEVNQLLEEIEDKQEELDDTSASAKAAMNEVDSLLAANRKQLQEKIDAEKAASANKNPTGSGSSSGSSGSSGSSSGMSSNMFLWPVSGSYTITSPFGYRIHPITGVQKFHKGVDISGGGINGKPILAVEDGVVLLAGYNAGGYGNYVILSHGTLSDGNSYETLYGHMSSYIVSSGQSVKRGQVIGYVGSTGASTGPHLHLEVHRNGSLTDPMGYFKRLG